MFCSFGSSVACDHLMRNMMLLQTTAMNTSGTSGGTEKGAGYSLHQLQGDKQHGVTRTGHLLKKSEGKMRRVWQKRRCRVQAEGFLDICHADETKPPTRVNLLTCQIKLVPDDKRCFDLISCEFDFFHINVLFPLLSLLGSTQRKKMWLTDTYRKCCVLLPGTVQLPYCGTLLIVCSSVYHMDCDSWCELIPKTTLTKIWARVPLHIIIPFSQ